MFVSLCYGPKTALSQVEQFHTPALPSPQAEPVLLDGPEDIVLPLEPLALDEVELLDELDAVPPALVDEDETLEPVAGEPLEPAVDEVAPVEDVAFTEVAPDALVPADAVADEDPEEDDGEPLVAPLEVDVPLLAARLPLEPALDDAALVETAALEVEVLAIDVLEVDVLEVDVLGKAPATQRSFTQA